MKRPHYLTATIFPVMAFLSTSTQMAFANASDPGEASSLFFQKALSLNERGVFLGKLVSGGAKCEDKIFVLNGNGLSYGFPRATTQIGKVTIKDPLKSPNLNVTSSIEMAGVFPYGITDTKFRGRYWLGTETSHWSVNAGMYPYYRPLSSSEGLLFVKSYVNVSIDSGKVIVLQDTKFKEQEFWAYFLYPVVEKISKRITLQRFENGDLEYTVTQASDYSASNNELNHHPIPAGHIEESLKCRYQDVSEGGAQ